MQEQNSFDLFVVTEDNSSSRGCTVAEQDTNCYVDKPSTKSQVHLLRSLISNGIIGMHKSCWKGEVEKRQVRENMKKHAHVVQNLVLNPNPI